MTEEVIEPQVEQTEAQSEAAENAAIAEGYNRVAGKDEKVEPEKTESVPAKPALEAPAPAAQPAPDPWKDVNPVIRAQFDELNKRNTKLESDIKSAIGRVGSVQAALDAAKAATTAAQAPTTQQIAAANTPAKLAALTVDWPDWGEAFQEALAFTRDDILKQIEAKQKTDAEAATKRANEEFTLQKAAWIDEAESFAYLRMKHPTYKKTINTPEFAAWRQAQAPEINALGASADADDAVRMLDLYAEHKTNQDKAAAKAAKAQERLAAAVPVQGQGTSGPSTPTEDELIAQGYNRVRGKG